MAPPIKNDWKDYLWTIIATIIISTILCLPQACNEVEATKEECKSAESLAKAVVDRGLGPLDILVCQEDEEPEGTAIYWKGRPREE